MINIEKENFRNSIKKEIEDFINSRISGKSLSLININIEKDEDLIFEKFDWIICIDGEIITLNGSALSYECSGFHKFFRSENSFEKEEIYDIAETILEELFPNLSVARNTFSQTLDIDIDEDNISKYLEETCCDDIACISAYDWNFYINFGDTLSRSIVKSTNDMSAVAFVDIDETTCYYLPVHNKEKMRNLPLMVRKYFAVHLNEREKEINKLIEKIDFYRSSI